MPISNSVHTHVTSQQILQNMGALETEFRNALNQIQKNNSENVLNSNSQFSNVFEFNSLNLEAF